MKRILLHDIPHRNQYQGCTIWGYFDPSEGKEPVGFGTLQFSTDYADPVNPLPHFYIPALAAKPGLKGYGKLIVDSLIESAATTFRRYNSSISITDRIFLEVYVANERAYNLYLNKCGFVTLNADSPLSDPEENDAPYYVMAQRISIAPAQIADS